MLIATRFDARPGPLAVPMAHSDATARHLLAHGLFGSDLIRFPAGGRVPEHTHPGAHQLFVLSGEGWVEYEGVAHPLFPGVCYLIPGGARHAVRAATELTLIAVGDDWRPPDSDERLDLTVSNRGGKAMKRDDVLVPGGGGDKGGTPPLGGGK